MKKPFIVPVSTMLVGLVGWIAFLFARGVVGWLGVVVAAVAGGLMVFSAVRCRAAGGPRAGAIVRTALLALMAASAHWRVGVFAEYLLLACAGAVLAQVFQPGPRQAAAGATAPTSAES